MDQQILANNLFLASIISLTLVINVNLLTYVSSWDMGGFCWPRHQIGNKILWTWYFPPKSSYLLIQVPQDFLCLVFFSINGSIKGHNSNQLSGGNFCSDMCMESVELAMAEAKEAGETSQRTRASRHSIYFSNWGLNQSAQHAYAS